MKAKVIYSIPVYVDEIDLEDYGHDSETTFEQLSEEDQNIITDQLRSEIIVNASVETIEQF